MASEQSSPLTLASKSLSDRSFVCRACGTTASGLPSADCSQCGLTGQHPDGYVCAACLKNHRENSAFLPGHHFLVTDGAAPCGFVLAELGIPPSSGSCGRHPDQFLTVRCMGCPDRPFLCDTCRPGHAGHDIAVISDLVPGELEGLLKAIYGPLHLPDGTAAPTPLLAPTLASTLRQRTRLAGLRTRPTAAARKPLSASALVSVSPEDMKEAMKILESVGGSPEFLHALSASPLAITAAATTGARMSRFGIAGKDVVIDGLEQAGFAIPPGGTLRFQMGLSPEAAILLGPVASAACAAIGGGVTAAAVLMHDLMGATKVVATVMHPPSAADGAPSAPPVEVTPVIRLSMRGCIEVLLRLPPGTPDHSTLRVEEIVVSALPLNLPKIIPATIAVDRAQAERLLKRALRARASTNSPLPLSFVDDSAPAPPADPRLLRVPGGGGTTLCVGPKGVMFCPKCAEPTVYAVSPVGLPLPSINVASVGLTDFTRSAAYDEASKALLLADDAGPRSAVVCVDAVSFALRWTTRKRCSFQSCYGLAVLPRTGLFVASSFADNKLHVHRVADGRRVASTTAQEPSFVAADPASSTVFVCCRTTSDPGVPVTYSVAAFLVDAPPAVGEVSKPVTIRPAGLIAAAGKAPQWRALTCVPPPAGAAPGTAAELVVATVGTPLLRVLSLRDQSLLRALTLPDAAVQAVCGLPGGNGLAVCDARSGSLDVHAWPFPPVPVK